MPGGAWKGVEAATGVGGMIATTVGRVKESTSEERRLGSGSSSSALAGITARAGCVGDWRARLIAEPASTFGWLLVRCLGTRSLEAELGELGELAPEVSAEATSELERERWCASL